MYAERRPKGFGFSDTAFRIFALMASRRLNSDRFFTTDYTPQVYTRAGLRWIEDNTMLSVLRRHYPELDPVVGSVGNAFHPGRGGRLTGQVEGGQLGGQGPPGEHRPGGPEHLRGDRVGLGQGLAQLPAERVGVAGHAGTPTGTRRTGRTAGAGGAASWPASWARYR